MNKYDNDILIHDVINLFKYSDLKHLVNWLIKDK